MDNNKNKSIYSKWAKIYDYIFGSNYFNKQRERSIKLLDLKKGDKILLVGMGTGEDLRYIPKGVSVVGIDITERMLEVAREKAVNLGMEDIIIENMDGTNLKFKDEEFDAVILHLIMSVIPNPNRCLKETYRVLKYSGKIVIFDKFLEAKKESNFFRKTLNSITMKLGTDINRKFSEIKRDINIQIKHESNSLFGGMYKILLLEKIETIKSNG